MDGSLACDDVSSHRAKKTENSFLTCQNDIKPSSKENWEEEKNPIPFQQGASPSSSSAAAINTMRSWGLRFIFPPSFHKPEKKHLTHFSAWSRQFPAFPGLAFRANPALTLSERNGSIYPHWPLLLLHLAILSTEPDLLIP